jgi:hypothetical protein
MWELDKDVLIDRKLNLCTSFDVSEASTSNGMHGLIMSIGCTIGSLRNCDLFFIVVFCAYIIQC